ncbi:MAG TPA: hypothetical protein PLD33_02240 [Anaerolineales bacterium]|nr:hypothetical protein [Anaerolineales bacterium]
MLRSYLISLFAAALFLAGCAQSTATAYPNPETGQNAISMPSLQGDWRIKLTHSGGIMGLLRTMEISSDGSYTVTDERSSQTVTKTLGPKELQELTRLISSAQYIAPSGPNGMVCADCFVYDLEIKGSDSTFTIQLNDISLPDSGMAPVIAHLRDLIDKALK